TVQRGQEALQDAHQACNDNWKAWQYPTAPQIVGVVHDDFEAEHVLAFGIGLECQFAEMQLEHGQVIHGCLKHDVQPGSTFPVPLGATAHAEQRPHLAHVQPTTSPVNYTLKDLVQLGAAHKQQVSTVLHLVDGVGVVETGPLLLFEIQSETQTTRIDP